MEKWKEEGRMEIRGKAVKIAFKAVGEENLKFFCLLADVLDLIDRKVEYVRIFQDNEGEKVQ
ncbi:hypothetical protein ES703_97607 [subsurface metagenome]